MQRSVENTDKRSVAMETKRCPGFGRGPHTLPANLENFDADKDRAGGLGAHCKDCRRAYKRMRKAEWKKNLSPAEQAAEKVYQAEYYKRILKARRAKQ